VNQSTTVVVIEHHLDVIKTSDRIIGLGPEGGEEGGKLVARGTPEQVAGTKSSLHGTLPGRDHAPQVQEGPLDDRERERLAGVHSVSDDGTSAVSGVVGRAQQGNTCLLTGYMTGNRRETHAPAGLGASGRTSSTSPRATYLSRTVRACSTC
jgi:hypothetical protein